MKIEFLIRDIRKSKKLTLKQLQRKSGVSKTEINDIERGDKMPNIITLELIAKGLQTNITELYKVIEDED
ncbi:MAG: helix-turn-helix transcriptional regulator [Bacilli bacterium]|nr:helix-turn-helix transcriptional regulator [Bacilli bacterium]